MRIEMRLKCYLVIWSLVIWSTRKRPYAYAKCLYSVLCLDRLECLDRSECLDRLECLERLEGSR